MNHILLRFSRDRESRQCLAYCTVCVSTLLYYISQVIWVSKYSTGWWPHIRWGRLEMKLPRPNYTKLDPFFCKKGGVYIFQSKAFFLGSRRSLFSALGTVCQKWGGFSKKEGVFYALECFSNVMLRDMLAVKYKDKKTKKCKGFVWEKLLPLMNV